MNVKSELSSNQIVILNVSGADYNKSILRLMKSFSGKKVCYFTLSKTYSSLKEMFEKAKVDTKNILFVDAISKTIKKVSDTSDCLYSSSPGALTEMSLILSKVLKYNFDYIVFDSLTSLFVYQKENVIAKFLSSIINKIKSTNAKVIFYAVESGETKSLVDRASGFVDKVLDWKDKSK